MQAGGLPRRVLSIAVILTAMTGPRLVEAGTVYVSPEGDDGNTGLTWAAAKRTVQGGLETALAGDEVWVKAGTYVERITLKTGVALYGGFVGNETELAQRNWVTNPTVLDGNALGRVVTAPSGATQSTRIDGFTIRNGSLWSSGGAGIFCEYSSPTIANNTITGNTVDNGSGGGIYCSSSSAMISNNMIIGNSARVMGGGIYEISPATAAPTISNNVIAGNIADSGGGLYCYSSAAGIINNTIIGNSAITAGGGVYCSGPSHSPQIVNNIVAFNSSGLCSTGLAPVLRNNCVYNAGANYSGLSAGTSDIAVDPRLSAPGCGEFHLQAGSPCIYAGDNSVVQVGAVDMDDEPRIQQRRVDIGADEFNGTTPGYTLRIVRVHPSGNDANDGTSWGSAKRTVQSAIDAAGAAVGGEVWVAGGTYAERVTLKQFVHVYGGFAGTETARDQRDRIAHVTILDGGAGGTVVTASSIGYRLSTMDGFIIRNGSASGILCSYASPVISNNRITRNTAGSGGGIRCSCSSPAITSNTITGNTAKAADTSGTGGGLSLFHSTPTICNNTISGNLANGQDGQGGGIYCYDSSAVIANNTITANVADKYATYQGGAVWSGSSSPTICNNVLAFNSSGLYANGGAPTVKNNCVYNPGGPDYSGLSPGTGDVSADPQLLAPGYDDLHLMAGSPCINAGDDSIVPAGSLDIDGQPRIQGGRVDIGADEFNGATPPFAPTVVRVSPWGDDANEGLTWGSAKLTVQAAVDAAAAAGGGEVWVAAGTYRERITLQTWVHVYGGFNGTEMSREQRKWATPRSVLDGGGAGTVVTASSLVYGSSTIDGFTIRNGSASGIYCYYAAPKISNNMIVGNDAGTHKSGGGIHCYYSQPAICGNRIAENSAKEYGGGICCMYSSPRITNNTVTANVAVAGGGWYGSGSSSTISNNIFAFNSSGLCVAGGWTPTLNNNCVYNPPGANYSGLSAGTGDISADPRLVAAEYGELHLQAGSPCIDAGVDGAVALPVDMDGQSRIQGSHVDIGADEFGGATPPFAPRVIRVSPSGNDANDGSAWELAKLSVQAAIDAGAGAGGGFDVWVAAGTYSELIQLKSWIHVYGGFAGTETRRDQRGRTVLGTVLDGGGSGNVVTALTPGCVSSTIDGFTIRNGHTGIYCDGASPVISNNSIIANGVNALTIEGGAICCYNGSPVIFNNWISGNDAGPGGGGGGIFCGDRSSPAIFNNAIVGNTASNLGGGICSLRSNHPVISNNTIVGNTARLGGAVYCWDSPVISNNIMAFNSSGIYAGTPTLRNNCVYNPDGANYYNVSAGVGDISVDPRFVDPRGGDYRLAPGSPCIDAGYNAALPAGMLTDMDGNPRLFDDPATPDCQWSPGNCGTAPIVDMGAYEVPVVPGDFDADGDVDTDDLTTFEACASGSGVPFTGGCAGADFDQDLDVDQDDFGVLQRCLGSVSTLIDFNCTQ